MNLNLTINFQLNKFDRYNDEDPITAGPPRLQNACTSWILPHGCFNTHLKAYSITIFEVYIVTLICRCNVIRNHLNSHSSVVKTCFIHQGFVLLQCRYLKSTLGNIQLINSSPNRVGKEAGVEIEVSLITHTTSV